MKKSIFISALVLCASVHQLVAQPETDTPPTDQPTPPLAHWGGRGGRGPRRRHGHGRREQRPHHFHHKNWEAFRKRLESDSEFKERWEKIKKRRHSKRGGGRQRGGWVCRGGVCRRDPAFAQHRKIQNDFKAISEKLGIAVPPAPGRGHAYGDVPRAPQQQTVHQQPEFNAIRSKLNEIFSKEEPLTEVEKNEAEQKIAELEALNPARWPRPEDYRRALERHLLQ